jgi:hypothetical protein
MHCVLQNIAETSFKLWNRTKLDFENDSPPSPSHLSKQSIETISKSLHLLERILIPLPLSNQ